MEDGSFLRMTPKLAWRTWPNIEILGPNYNWRNIKGALQVYYRTYNKTANIEDKNFKVYNDV